MSGHERPVLRRRLRAAPAAGGDYRYGLLLEGARPPEEETRRVLSSMVPVETG